MRACGKQINRCMPNACHNRGYMLHIHIWNSISTGFIHFEWCMQCVSRGFLWITIPSILSLRLRHHDSLCACWQFFVFQLQLDFGARFVRLFSPLFDFFPHIFSLSLSLSAASNCHCCWCCCCCFPNTCSQWKIHFFYVFLSPESNSPESCRECYARVHHTFQPNIPQTGTNKT